MLFGFINLGSYELHQSDLLDELVGKWEYRSTSYTMQIEFFKASSQVKAYYTISSQNGARMDIGSKEEINIELGSINDGSLSLVVKSVYSDAEYTATITKMNLESIRFDLGNAIKEDINLYPAKPIILNKLLSGTAN